MAFERKWAHVPPRAFTSDGTASGLITIASTSGFKVKQTVAIKSATQSIIQLQVKRVLSSTTLIVGPLNKSIDTKSDMSAYTVADTATISAEEQKKNQIFNTDQEQAIYEQEPTLARRLINVDEWGNFYTEDNPIPTASFSYKGLIPPSFDDVVLTYTANKDIDTAKYYKDGALLATVTLTYNANFDIIRAVRT